MAQSTTRKSAKVSRSGGKPGIKDAVALNTAPKVTARATGTSTIHRPAARPSPIHDDIRAYNGAQSPSDQRICDALAQNIAQHLPGAESKIWHRHPVWFLDGNPLVGYSKLKDSIRLLFWSGQSFHEPGLAPEGTFKAAEARYTSDDQIPVKDLKRWLRKSIEIQWDYKNIVKRKGRLERLK